MGLEESVCCKQILISGPLKVAERRKQNFRSQLCQSPMDCNMEEAKGQKASFAARDQCVPWTKMATVPAVLDSVRSQVTFARSSSSAGEGCTP